MRTTAVRVPGMNIYEQRQWVRPLVVACCPSCAYRAVAVSVEASDAALWAHASAMHMGGFDASQE